VGASVFFGNQKIAEQKNSSSLLKMRKVYIYIILYDKCCITCSEREGHTHTKRRDRNKREQKDEEGSQLDEL
jgi:hypothetical protein